MAGVNRADTIYASHGPDRVERRWHPLFFCGILGRAGQLRKVGRRAAVEISSVRQDLGLPYVGEDNEAIGRLASEHLLERNFKSFAWAPFWDDQVNEERYLGFSRSLQAAGYECLRLIPVNRKAASHSRHLNWTLRRSSLIRAIRSLHHPVGIFCYNDYVATDIMDACIEAGIRIPQEVAVIGVDNDPILCECAQVPLTSVRHDLEGMAYQAAALLDRLMEGQAAPMMCRADSAKRSHNSKEHRRARH